MLLLHTSGGESPFPVPSLQLLLDGVANGGVSPHLKRAADAVQLFSLSRFLYAIFYGFSVLECFGDARLDEEEKDGVGVGVSRMQKDQEPG